MARKSKYRWITAYAVTRHYGGPEEGGWWYNRYSPIISKPIPTSIQGQNWRANKKRELLRKQLIQDQKHIKEGDISSVLGGVDLDVCFESCRHEFKSEGRPHYE